MLKKKGPRIKNLFKMSPFVMHSKNHFAVKNTAVKLEKLLQEVQQYLHTHIYKISNMMIVVLLTLILHVSFTRGACPSGELRNSWCYELTSSTYNWHNAQSYCSTTYGGGLLFIVDTTEQAWVFNTLKPDTDAAWIGLNDIAVEGSYQWIYGSSPLYLTSYGSTNTAWADCIILYAENELRDRACTE